LARQPAESVQLARVLKSQNDAISALIASFLGWTVDAFDFFVLVFVLSKAAADFHVSLKDQMTLAITVTLVFRPLGAVIFGLLADHYGRRRPMIANLVFFSVMEVLSGLAPSFGVFMVCRALFGIGMGGEWGVGAALAMEKVPPRWRGLFSGLLQQGYPCGYLLAACCFRFLPESWSWRALFFIGVLPALLAVFVCCKVKESEVWRRHRAETWTGLGRAVACHWKLFLYLAALMTMMNLASHGTQDLYPSFLEQERHFSKAQVGNTAIIYNLGAVAGGVCFGLFSDRVGRRRSMALALLLAVGVIPLWSSGATATALVAGAFLMQFLVQGAWGVIPAHITEVSPNAVRGFLPGFAYQCGVLLAGNAAHVEAQLSKGSTYSNAMAMTAFAAFCLGALVIVFGPERKAAAFAAEA
jgi:SHS family lactate transporter-like MFS transporter